MQFKRKTYCRECPFRKEAIKGWLGPYTPEDVMAHVHSEGGFACHMSTNALVKKNPEISDNDLAEKAHVCVGSLHHANKSFKAYRPGNPLREMQDKVGQPPANILDRWQFMEHHAGIPDPRKRKA